MFSDSTCQRMVPCVAPKARRTPSSAIRRRILDWVMPDRFKAGTSKEDEKDDTVTNVEVEEFAPELATAADPFLDLGGGLVKDIGLDVPGLGVELLDLPQRLGPQLLPRDARSQQDPTAIRAVDALLVSPSSRTV